MLHLIHFLIEFPDIVSICVFSCQDSIHKVDGLFFPSQLFRLVCQLFFLDFQITLERFQVFLTLFQPGTGFRQFLSLVIILLFVAAGLILQVFNFFLSIFQLLFQLFDFPLQGGNDLMFISRLQDFLQIS